LDVSGEYALASLAFTTADAVRVDGGQLDDGPPVVELPRTGIGPLAHGIAALVLVAAGLLARGVGRRISDVGCNPRAQ
jgi:hypothetical protein